MVDSSSFDHSLRQSSIVDETMLIDHLLYIDDQDSEKRQIKNRTFIPNDL